MQNTFRTILLAAAVAVGIPSASPHLVINEIMQSNIDCIIDDFNEFPDSWVELYNPGPDAESLADYSLATKDKPSKAFRLPAGSIPPGKYIIIYCDKADRGRHTDFRLESGKDGAVYLFKNDEIVDRLENLKKQPAPNIAYGRKTDNADEWGYQATPTPGKTNCGTLCHDILGEPIFSHHGKVTSETFDLSLSLPADAPEGTSIRYTLDGTEPTETSPLYTAPIHISLTRTVRARLFCDGYLSPRSTTHSYIRHPRALTLPVVSMVTDRDYFYGNKMGIYVQGNYSNHTPNYEYDWRRPINIEFFETADSESRFNQLCETRVKGGASRSSAIKSLAVYANKRFGEKRFNYEFFPDQTPGIQEFKSFELRNSGNDFDYMYMRDAIIQQSMGMNCDIDWQPSRPAILYINGEYKGILNLRPRSNEDNIYSYYDGLEDIDMVENWWELKEGSIDSFNSFKDFYNATDHSFAEYEAVMDIEEYCNIMIMNIFFDNKDFPGNNIVMWRPQADGGRWRWVAKDTDFGMGLYDERYSYPTLDWISTPGYDNNKNDWANSADATRLFRRLIATPEFRDMFIDRCAVYMGDFLTPDAIIARIDERVNAIESEFGFHRKVNPSWTDFSQEVDKARTWTRKRSPFFYGHLAAHFRLPTPIPLVIDSDHPADRTFTINGIPLSGNRFDGKFFPGRRLTVTSHSPSDGLYVNGWKVTVATAEGTSTTSYTTETLSIDMPDVQSVEISPILADHPMAIEEISEEIDYSLPFDIYDTTGRCHGSSSPAALSSLAPGIYILRQNGKAKKISL